MNENLDLTKILKDAPKGTKLWSPICGECMLQYIDSTSTYFPIVCLTTDKYGNEMQILFTKYGSYHALFAYSECILFPSKGNRDWATFKVPNTRKHFEPFQKVLCATDNDFGYEVWAADFYSHYDEALCKHYLISGFVGNDNEIIPFEGNEDKLGTIVKQ